MEPVTAGQVLLILVPFVVIARALWLFVMLKAKVLKGK
ncbi:hypothetical protein [Klebsiella phage vB_KpnP_cmc355D]|uniref:Uncharacterized protein n=1 Tax=Klebsiella phage vB_KpnP_cmc355D TaxID=3110534 RepID=A0ABZ0ZXI6_9CAUD|nr:hypothetical protein A3a_00035 [Klebsiella phage VLCpiA3a]WQZ00620.1 hypothetical protein [Klebsiella phage vB_KpnP_cmc355D]